MADIKWSQFPSASPGDSDEVVGLHAGGNARFSVANFILAIRQRLANIFVPLTRTINGKGLSTDISLDASDVGAVDTADVGAANGVASLDSTGKVPGTQLDLSGKQSTITASGILKGDGAGGVSAATAGTDYQAPLTAGTDYATPAQLADKAAKADLTSIQATGTTNTTGAAIPAGAYFYLNGVLHKAKTLIDQNATFTVNTNCEAVTIGDQIKNVPFILDTSGITQTDYNIRETQLRYIGSGFLIMWFNITCNTPQSGNVIVGNLPAGVPSPSAIITETYVSGAGTAVESMTVQIRTNRTVNCRYGHAGTGYTGTFVIPL